MKMEISTSTNLETVEKDVEPDVTLSELNTVNNIQNITAEEEDEVSDKCLNSETVSDEQTNDISEKNDNEKLCSSSSSTINEPSTSSSTKEKSKSPSEDKLSSIYHIKWISQNGRKTPIVMQNENGPCPLIAIINVLILRGCVKLPLTADYITAEKLIEYVGDCLFDSVPKNIPLGTQLNYEQNIHDAMAVLPKLQTGLDVNVKFFGISAFEYTPECIIFDLLRISLYHGWLIDPQMIDVVKAVGNLSYNQLVEKIINCKSSLDPDEATLALVAENFLEKTASQLTYHGLCELTATLKEDELCVLFRNNHFISLVKHNSLLYQLVTDQGFLNENVVWESLYNIEGDGQFFDSSFILVPPKPANDTPVPVACDVTQCQQIDQDYLVAVSLQDEQQKQLKNELEWESFKKQKFGIADNLTDEELARYLQEEENEAHVSQYQTQQEQPVPNSPPRNKNRDCRIL